MAQGLAHKEGAQLEISNNESHCALHQEQKRWCGCVSGCSLGFVAVKSKSQWKAWLQLLSAHLGCPQTRKTPGFEAP